jgi:uncharacterized protein (TIGR02996 family)
LRERSLHDAVLAAPDDDRPRLVYADWLGERGGVVVTCNLMVAHGDRS